MERLVQKVLEEKLRSIISIPSNSSGTLRDVRILLEKELGLPEDSLKPFSLELREMVQNVTENIPISPAVVVSNVSTEKSGELRKKKAVEVTGVSRESVQNDVSSSSEPKISEKETAPPKKGEVFPGTILGLGSETNVVKSEFRGKEYLHIRKYPTVDGKVIAGKGISLVKSEWTALKAGIVEIDKELERIKNT